MSRPAAPVHTDHPLRHWDRTCPACLAEYEAEHQPESETPETDAHLSHLNLPDGNKVGIPIETVALLKSLERRLSISQTEIKGQMRVKDDLQAQITELEKVLSLACAVAEAGFDTDYGFNYEASLEPRRIIAKIREALKSRA